MEASPAEYAELTAETGSAGWVELRMWANSFSLLPVAGISPELPDLECSLVSVELVVWSVAICSAGPRPRDAGFPERGVSLLPDGVARRRAGGAGRSEGSGAGTPLFTAWTLGEDGIARPRRGALVPLALLLPGIGGRRIGAGDDSLFASSCRNDILTCCGIAGIEVVRCQYDTSMALNGVA